MPPEDLPGTAQHPCASYNIQLLSRCIRLREVQNRGHCAISVSIGGAPLPCCASGFSTVDVWWERRCLAESGDCQPMLPVVWDWCYVASSPSPTALPAVTHYPKTLSVSRTLLSDRPRCCDDPSKTVSASPHSAHQLQSPAQQRRCSVERVIAASIYCAQSSWNHTTHWLAQ